MIDETARGQLSREVEALRGRVAELEAARAEDRRTLSTLLANLPGMAYRCRNDPDWTMEIVSEGCLALTGHPPGDLLGNRAVSYADLIHPEDRDRVWDEVQAALEKKAPFRITYRLHTASGEERWVWEQGVGVFDAGGKLEALEGFITDVTERQRALETLERHRDRLEEMVFERTSDLVAANQRLTREAREREQAEAARQESERRTRAIFDQTFQFIGLLTPDGTLVEANRTALEFAGVPASEVLGRPFWETPWWSHSPELQERLRRAVQEVARGEFVRFEATHPGPDGTLAFVDFSLKPVKDETGAVVYLVPEGRDITDLKEAEDARRRSERRVRAIFDQTFQFIAMLEPDGTMVEVNRTALRFIDAEPADVLGRPFWDTPWWSHSPRLQERLRRAVQAVARGEFVRFEATHPGSDGKVAYIDFSLKPVKDETGAVEFLIPEGRDITEHKRDEARLRERTAALAESEHKYRTLVENVPLVVYRLNPRGEVVFVNRFVQEAFGYSPEEVLADPGLWHRWVHDEDRSAVEQFRTKGVQEGEEFLAEYRVRHRRGQTVHVLDHAIPSRSADGQVASVGGILLDVTGRVKLREQMVRAKELETLNEVSARLAHEFRNPLASIGGFARRLLAALPLEDPNRQPVQIIVQDVGRLEAILGTVLTYIQPLELALAPADPNPLVEAALAAVGGDAEAAGVRIDVRLAPDVPPIAADASRLGTALETLLRNALSQMGEGQTLAVATSRQDEMFHLSLRYPVQTLSPDDVQDFFYPFTSTRMAEHAEQLPMSKILLHKHGGTVDVALDGPNRIVLSLSLPPLKS